MSYSQAAQGRGSNNQAKVQAVQNKSEVDLLKSCHRELAQADEISTRTCERLNSQTEQLKRIHNDTEVINGNLDQSEHLLRGLGRWGWFKNLFHSEPEAKNLAPASSSGGYPASASSQPKAAAAAAPSQAASGAERARARLLAEEAARNPSGSAARPAPAAGANAQANGEDPEAERLYDDMENMLAGLKVKTQAINQTLDVHNQMLPEIESNMTRAQDRIKKQSAQMAKR
eukprot:gnl/TRDRNA2_/TRDRNA2_39934_c0_seq1.p1 gnl/TRDRNA2_/TRDRNA2_39934_c0~~gnl/TRDRNA2_/TRDRNA2_39934_c0_seq1.p1  ORF type:complete len:230 (-),score=49.31 gnl/TRDRNA2_/TRDRNA2_39934_c0_seq1:73-762(-)